MAPTIELSAHFTHGDCAARSLRRQGATLGHCTRDLLTVGPSAVEPARHRALRNAHWCLDDADPGAEAELAAAVAALPADRPIVLWAARVWSDQLWLWWALDALSRLDVAQTRIWWAAPATGHHLASVGAATPEAIVAALARADQVTPALARLGCALWRDYAAPAPLAFDAARRAGSALLPELARIAAPHGDWFPRLVDGRLRLSELDELVLVSVGADWRTPEQMVQTPPGDALRERLFLPYGDRFLLARLAAWSEHGALERELRDQHPWSGLAFRWPPSGRRRLDAGLDSVADAPTLAVGGCGVHDAAVPWIRQAAPEGWKLTAGH